MFFSPIFFLSYTLLAVPVGSTLSMTFVSMATWVLLSPIHSDTCLCVWCYYCALLWFYWGVWGHYLVPSWVKHLYHTRFILWWLLLFCICVLSTIWCWYMSSAVVCSLHFYYCELCGCEILVCIIVQEMQVAIDTTPWIVVDPSPPLLSFGAHFHVHSWLPYAARPKWSDC